MKIRKFITTNTINNPQKKKKRATFRRLRAMIKECRELSDELGMKMSVTVYDPKSKMITHADTGR